MPKRIAVLGSFDTKGRELGFLRDRIRQMGFVPVCIDTSLGGEPSDTPDVTSRQVAAAAGADIEEIRKSTDTRSVTEQMIRGASTLIRELFQAGRIEGIVSIGGASNTGLATTVMGALPFGVPKLMVSSMAAVPAYAGSYFGTKDIAMIHSVVDVAGLNPLLENVLARAAGAICGMVESGTGALNLSGDHREGLVLPQRAGDAALRLRGRRGVHPATEGEARRARAAPGDAALAQPAEFAETAVRELLRMMEQGRSPAESLAR